MNTRNKYSFRDKSRIERIGIIALSCVLVTFIAFGVQRRYSIAIQYDRSVSFTIGLLDKNNKDIRKGEYFAFEFLAVKDDDRYGQHFVKRLGCMEGEYLVTKGRDFFCDGKFIGRAKEFSMEGKPLPVFIFDGYVPPGRLFAVGEIRDSYDSKFWGFVAKEWVLGTVKRVV